MADTRDEIGKALEGALAPDQLKMLLDDVLEIRKKVWGDFECKHCGQRQRQLAEIPDAKAVTGALTDLMTQSWGRPEAQSTERSIVVNREVFVVSDADETGGHDVAGASSLEAGREGADGPAVPA